MKKNIYLIFTGLALIFIASCTKNFEEINTNPNNPDKAPLTNVFAYIIQNLSAKYGTTEMEYAGSYVGYVTKGTYTDVTRYVTSPSPSIWNGVYSTTVRNSNFVIDEAEKEGNKNLQAATMILKAYGLQLVTDIYGKVPYTEAGQALSGVIHPKYDSEELIYNDLLSQLDLANEMLEDKAEAGLLGDGDLLYSGDILKWKKFCNSLHLRMAVRISNVNPDKAKAEISKILSDPVKYPIFESNDDNAYLEYPGEDWIEPWTARHSSIGDDWAAKPIVDALLDYNDPRIAYYIAAKPDGTYDGLAVGQELDKLYSKLNDLFIKNPTGRVYFLKYSEVELIKAEAAQRGFVNLNAKEAYESAITASCKEYGISDTDIASYLQGVKVAYNNDLNQIYMQKWIALFRQSWEAWAEMRRTDIPTLPPAVNSAHTGHNRVPFRFSYPDDEKKLNASNIPADVNEVDNYWGYQIWWDTRTGVE